jgi:hypothetical protein
VPITSTTFSVEERGSSWWSPSSLRATRAKSAIGVGAATWLPDPIATTGVAKVAAGAGGLGLERTHGSASEHGGSNKPEGTDPRPAGKQVAAAGEWSRVAESGSPPWPPDLIFFC